MSREQALVEAVRAFFAGRRTAFECDALRQALAAYDAADAGVGEGRLVRMAVYRRSLSGKLCATEDDPFASDVLAHVHFRLPPPATAPELAGTVETG